MRAAFSCTWKPNMNADMLAKAVAWRNLDLWGRDQRLHSAGACNNDGRLHHQQPAHGHELGTGAQEYG